MEEIIAKLTDELSVRYTETMVLTFVGFVKISPDILSKLERDFNSGLSHCIEIIEHVRKVKV